MKTWHLFVLVAVILGSVVGYAAWQHRQQVRHDIFDRCLRQFGYDQERECERLTQITLGEGVLLPDEKPHPGR
jgi:hypothetical protein